VEEASEMEGFLTVVGAGCESLAIAVEGAAVEEVDVLG